ncbi:hypothetical protein RND71_007785 [Anisodus tanguticus]|uniref:Uncharacterized protein n=1 Tax=Anisodus tanguticus TaxID=243964 RepID=A0AAE1VQ24_9SOLA|nr:hypothetical protein RND71_007785 [Anisodus tanguticus]
MKTGTRVRKSITAAVFPVAFLFLLSFVACSGPLRWILLSSYLIYYLTLSVWILAALHTT